MEKLIVKNFGPIKEAEIDLTKYVVFIGDTSSGKSVLAKLIAIFRDNDLLFSSDRKQDLKELLEHYNINFDNEQKFLNYVTDNFSIKLENDELNLFEKDKIIHFKKEQTISSRKANIRRVTEDINRLLETDSTDSARKSELRDLLNRFIESNNNFPATLPNYIPAERILISLVGSSISGLWANNVALPSYFKDFAGRYEVARKNIKNKTYKSLGFKYRSKNDDDFVTYNGKQIKLTQASSGIQSVIPLLIMMDYELDIQPIKKSILIEEPELNLFPIKQKKLLEYIVSSISNKLDNLIITTHSPYVLSVLDTFILAQNTHIEQPKLYKKISAIISEDKWIDYNDISVYEVKNDGTIQSLKNEEFKSIDTNAIDRVSDIISEEFDKLTELRYAQ